MLLSSLALRLYRPPSAARKAARAAAASAASSAKRSTVGDGERAAEEDDDSALEVRQGHTEKRRTCHHVSLVSVCFGRRAPVFFFKAGVGGGGHFDGLLFQRLRARKYYLFFF